jgi:hypothetical protein
MESTYKNALQQIIDFLENLEVNENIKYYLVGGILANLYSDFRITKDIDFVIDFNSSNIDINRYISLLQKNNFNPYQDWNTTMILAMESKIIQFLDKTNTVKYDNHIIERSSGNKYKKIGPIGLKRRVREKVFNIECWVASKEDFIMSKLVYGGWQDYTDALGCWMRFSKTLDLPYLNKISLNLGVQKEFKLLQSGIDDPDEYFKKIKGY